MKAVDFVRDGLVAAAGGAKGGFLPKNVVFVVHKPGYQAYRKSVESVYKSHGFIPVLLFSRGVSRRMVRRVYSASFQKAKRINPHVEEQLLKKYPSKSPSDKNIAVEFLFIPNSAIKKIGASDAWDAIKKVTGLTYPRLAAKRFYRDGFPTIRGRAFIDFRKGAAPEPQPPLNVVHVPDPHKVALENGFLTGRLKDLHIFIPWSAVLKARGNYKKLVREGMIK